MIEVTDKMVNTFTQAMLLSMPEVKDHYDQVKIGLEAVFNLESMNQNLLNEAIILINATLFMLENIHDGAEENRVKAEMHAFLSKAHGIV